MLKDVKWADDGTYSPQGEHSPLEFYTKALSNSNHFDLELGFFNSAAISLLSRSFATFIKNGGRMRMAINHIVSKEDKEAIQKGVDENQIIDAFDLADIVKLRQSLDEYGEQFFNCLAYLIQEKRIEIKIIRPKGKEGLAHTKRGQFCDGYDTISFTGSANFTISGLLNNREEITILKNCSPDASIQKKIHNQTKQFDTLMKGEAIDVEYLEAIDLVEAIKTEFGEQDIDELIDVERKLKQYKYEQWAGASCVMDDFDVQQEPSFPYATGPRDYQEKAYRNWLNNNQKGLFAMATGTGKTLTALNVLLHIYQKKRYYKAIILVPTITLVEQWEKECKKFHFDRIIKISTKSSKWKEDLQRLNFEVSHGSTDKKTSFVIISTYASFTKRMIFPILNGFSKNQVLLIADEAHNMGAESVLERLKDIMYYRRIGLSATPERQFDDEVNKKLFYFFGIKDRYTYEYSMREAIENGILCRYFYYPHLVSLTDEEMNRYEDLTIKISKYFNYDNEKFDKKDDILMNMLLARKRIIHKAANKLDMFRSIVRQRYDEIGNLKYCLVYVPEGYCNYEEYDDVFDDKECLIEDKDADRLIDLFSKAIIDIDPRITVKKITGETKDRDYALDAFSKGTLQVLTSMKCLDEGIDVPRSEMAIFCSSTGNPRQFIQRRGRVLRTHPNKRIAILHDLVVIPKITASSEGYRMERALLKGELKRVCNFAILSENCTYSQLELQDIMHYYGLNLFNNE